MPDSNSFVLHQSERLINLHWRLYVLQNSCFLCCLIQLSFVLHQRKSLVIYIHGTWPSKFKFPLLPHSTLFCATSTKKLSNLHSRHMTFKIRVSFVASFKCLWCYIKAKCLVITLTASKSEYPLLPHSVVFVLYESERLSKLKSRVNDLHNSRVLGCLIQLSLCNIKVKGLANYNHG